MKKTLLTAAVLTLALGISACSSGQPAETTAATEAAATAEETTTAEETEEETEEEIEEDYVSGTITAIDGDIITVKSDYDETEKNYDLSEAEIIQEFDLAEGDLVDITFPMDTTEDPVPVMILEVMESVIGESTDPSVEGLVKDATTNTITLEVDGEEYTLSRANAYVVAADGITVDKNATVTYFGDLDDEPTAVKIVMEDSYDTPEAEVNAFVGEVAQVGDNNIVLTSEEEDFFTFTSDEIDFSEYELGDILQISYEGSITEKEIPAIEVTRR